MTAAPALPNLWPEDIQLSVLPPVVVLRMQADGLRERTKGALEAEVTTTKGAEDFEIHRMQVVARQFGSSRHGIMSVTHRTELYPAVVEAKIFELEARKQTVTVTRSYGPALAEVTYKASEPKHPILSSVPIWPDPNDWRPVAASQEELIGMIGRVLKSMPVRALIESLLARGYEKKLHDTNTPQPVT